MTGDKRTFPRTLELKGRKIELHLMTAADRQALLDFALALPRHDLLFLRRDITDVSAIDAWIAEIESGIIQTVLAVENDAVIGYGTLHRSELQWSHHVAELRMMVAESSRGLGLGRSLTQEIFALALESGIEKMVARMTTDQKGAISTFEGLGFRPEALMRDHVKDLDGECHDLVVMSHPVEQFQQTLTAYGVDENLGA